MSGKLEKEKTDINPNAILENLKTAQVKYAGTEKIDGRKTHILDVKDLNKMILGVEGVQKVSGKFWIDARDWVVRKMELEYLEREDEKGEKRTVKITVRYEDFRKVKGMIMPYRTVVTVPVEMTPEEEQEMRKGMEEMRRELELAPPEMRKMIESEMRLEIEMMEKILAGIEAETVIVVKDVKINTGLSDDLFDRSKLKLSVSRSSLIFHSLRVMTRSIRKPRIGSMSWDKQTPVDCCFWFSQFARIS